MKLIESKAEYIPQEEGLEGIYKQIELAGRTAYHSQDKITPDSAKGFVDRMIKSGHTAMLEHGTVYLKMLGQGLYNQIQEHTYKDYVNNKYSKVCMSYEKDKETDLIGLLYANITTNLRVLVENEWLDDLKYLCEPTICHEKRYTFRMVTSIGVTRELNRHRVNSIAEQSTRYCNYAKDKFGNEVTFCKPVWVPDYDETDWDRFLKALFEAENAYLGLINQGWQPQQAREVLPLCTASEIIHTAFASDWRHVMDLRLFGKTGAPHPDMLDLMQKTQKAMQEAGIWEDIMSQTSTLKD